MTKTDIVDGALTAVKADARSIIGTAALLIIPAELVSAWVRRDSLGDSGFLAAFSTATDESASVADQLGAGTLWLIALQSLVLAFVTAVVAQVVSSWYQGDRVAGRAALGRAVRRSPAIAAAWLLVHLLELGGTILLIVPLLFVVALSAVTVPALVIEDLGPVRAIRRSWRLARTQLGSVIGTVLLIALVDAALSSALGGLGEVFTLLSWGWVVAAAIGGAASVITTPFVAAAATLLYLDLRVRAEGFDIEVGIAAHFPAAP
jgi:hypothetical protein